MRKKVGRTRRLSGISLLMLSAWMAFSPTALALRALPGTLRMSVGQTYALPGGVAVMSSGDERLISASGAALSGEKSGETEISVSFLGFLPLKRFHVSISEPVVLIPGGQAVGVALKTSGALVVGLTDIKGQNPAKEAGIRAGDIILSVDGEAVESSEDLSQKIAAAGGKAVRIQYLRREKQMETPLVPIRQDGAWRVGVWVRDSTAGVGTLSYYDPETNGYGALGHAISDPDTGLIMPVKLGNLFKARIVDVKKGARGAPGELRGSFLREQIALGGITQNGVYGIYGAADAPIKNPLYPDGLPIAQRDSVRTGKAAILSTVEGDEMKAYEIEIVSLARQNAPAQKSMVVRVTDEDLLRKTGGIVQGMSGSPILQDGRIIGAITHVFVDDPTQGYGVYIEWMLEAAKETANKAA